MVANQWHGKSQAPLNPAVVISDFYFPASKVLSKGFEYAMATKWTRLYFLAFHMSCVIVSLK